MGAFGGLTLTNRGRILQSKAQSGIQLKYTRIALGDGTLGTTSILVLNQLIHEVKSLNITKLKVLDQGRAVVGTVFTNQNLSLGFYFRELGVFAEDPDVGEVLYCYGNSGDLAEYIPAGGTDVIEKNIDIQTVIGNASNVTAIIDETLATETIKGAQEKANQAEVNAKTYTENELTKKVDKVAGKGLSTNDYTTIEKNKLSGIATGAQVNQNAFSNIKVGATIIAADSATDTLEIVAGNAVTLTPDTTNDKLTITVNDGTTAQKGAVQLNNTLTSTSTTQALTAAQGKELKDLVDTKANSTDLTTLSTTVNEHLVEFNQLKDYLNYMPINGGSFDGNDPAGPIIDGGTY